MTFIWCCLCNFQTFWLMSWTSSHIKKAILSTSWKSGQNGCLWKAFSSRSFAVCQKKMICLWGTICAAASAQVDSNNGDEKDFFGQHDKWKWADNLPDILLIEQFDDPAADAQIKSSRCIQQVPQKSWRKLQINIFQQIIRMQHFFVLKEKLFTRWNCIEKRWWQGSTLLGIYGPVMIRLALLDLLTARPRRRKKDQKIFIKKLGIFVGKWDAK